MAVIRGIGHIFHQFGPFFVVFSNYVVTFIQIIPDHINFSGISIRIHKIPANRMPELRQVYPHRANLGAVPA
jgi:hypothetical protein